MAVLLRIILIGLVNATNNLIGDFISQHRKNPHTSRNSVGIDALIVNHFR
nr:hypothetical protein [Staphylococcus hominis]